MSDMIRHLLSAAPKLIDLAEAKAAYLDWRLEHGYLAAATLLTPPDGNVKFAKSKDGVVYGLALAPSDVSGWQVCRWATPECRLGCVSFSGKGGMPKVAMARVDKTGFLAANPDAFVTLIDAEIAAAKSKVGDRLVVRLNTFSDLPWETIVPWLFVKHADVRFYDYTKNPDRTPPANYTLTFSVSDRTPDGMLPTLVEGSNLAVVFDTKRGADLPEQYLGIPVIDGDKTDVRCNDPKGVIVGLRAKGAMRNGDWTMVRKVAAAALV